MSQVNCQQCGTPLPVDDIFIEETPICPKCVGTPAAADVATIDEHPCPVCGHTNPSDALQCESCGERMTAHAPTDEDIKPTPVQVGRVFQEAWSIYRARFRLAFCREALGALLSILVIVFMIILPGGGKDESVLFYVVAHLGWSTFIQLGQARLAVRICRDQSPTFRDLLAEGEHVIPALIFYGATCVLGNCLLLPLTALFMMPFALLSGGEPGMLPFALCACAAAALLFPLFVVVPLATYFVLVDQQRGWLGSYGFALNLVIRNWWRLYVGLPLMFAACVAGLLTCGVALLFAVPYLWILAAVSYLHASGQERSLKSEA